MFCYLSHVCLILLFSFSILLFFVFLLFFYVVLFPFVCYLYLLLSYVVLSSFMLFSVLVMFSPLLVSYGCRYLSLPLSLANLYFSFSFVIPLCVVRLCSLSSVYQLSYLFVVVLISCVAAAVGVAARRIS